MWAAKITMKPHIILVLLLICHKIDCDTVKLTIYKGSGVQPYTFTGADCPYGILAYSSEPLKCACMTGLWAFYESTCGPPTIIAGGPQEKCITLDRKIEKVHLLSSPNGWIDNAVVFSDDMKTVRARLESGGLLPNGTAQILVPNSKPWGIPSQSLCFTSGNKPGTCTFDFTTTEDVGLAPKCDLDAKSVAPRNCHPPIEDATCPPAKIVAKGRVFSAMSKAVKAASGDANGIQMDAEVPTNITTSQELNLQIWNYLTGKAEELLNLSTKGKAEPPSLTFKLLDLAKRIIQKTCPESYVNAGHFDLALGAFTALQTRDFKFKDEFTDKIAAERIEDSLLNCLYNVEKYPFIEKLNRTVYANGSCDPPPELGTYELFGQRLELSINVNSTGRQNEPLIETVWKTFTHAHAACYKYFEDDYSDHHRFTSVIIPTFTNEISDVWNSITEVTPDTYSGLLGNAVELMDGVSYCAEFAKLESNYPWDLARPSKDLSNIRAKRSSPSDFECLKDTFDNTCPSD